MDLYASECNRIASRSSGAIQPAGASSARTLVRPNVLTVDMLARGTSTPSGAIQPAGASSALTLVRPNVLTVDMLPGGTGTPCYPRVSVTRINNLIKTVRNQLLEPPRHGQDRNLRDQLCDRVDITHHLDYKPLWQAFVLWHPRAREIIGPGISQAVIMAIMDEYDHNKCGPTIDILLDRTDGLQVRLHPNKPNPHFFRHGSFTGANGNTCWHPQIPPQSDAAQLAPEPSLSDAVPAAASSQLLGPVPSQLPDPDFAIADLTWQLFNDPRAGRNWWWHEASGTALWANQPGLFYDPHTGRNWWWHEASGTAQWANQPGD